MLKRDRIEFLEHILKMYVCWIEKIEKRKEAKKVKNIVRKANNDLKDLVCQDTNMKN